MLDKVKKILISYHYKVGYSSLYADETYHKFEAKEKNLTHNQYFTVYDKNKRVVCRLHDLKEGEDFNVSTHLPQVLHFFEIFEIPHREQIITQLKKLVK